MSAQTHSADTFDSLLKDLNEQREKAGVAGGAVIIVDDNQIRHAGGFGITHWHNPQPMHPDAWVRIGSVTKAFVGLAFLRAAEQGKLPLDAPLGALDAAHWVSNPWQDEHPVTLEQLLEHSAGLTDMVREEWDHNIPLPLTEALAVAPQSRALNWPAGLHSSYSNSGAGVAAAAAEQVLKIDFEQYVTEQVLRPMGMNHATFSAGVQPQLIGGYDRDGRTPIRYWHVLYRPFGGLNLPFSELGRFLQMLLGRGTLDGKEIFSPAQITRMENPASTAAALSGLTFGYGLGNYHQVHKGFVFHGHGGDADGYLTHCAYSLDAKQGFCVMINAFQGNTLRAMKRRVMDYIVNGLTPAYQAGVPQPMTHLQSLAGRYQQVTYRFPGNPSSNELVIALRDGRLWLDRDGASQHMVPLSRWHFRRRFEPVATTAFVEHEGTLLLQGPFGNYRRVTEPLPKR
ncbi:MAG: serine hydrolase domain-containing protein [Lysobacterales bacterium]